MRLVVILVPLLLLLHLSAASREGLPPKKWGEASGPCSFTSTSAWAAVSQNCGQQRGG